MEITVTSILILAGFYVGWNIGANDAANCIGTTVGARVVSYRTAVAIMVLFVILGGALQGHRVMTTVGKGIVLTSSEAYADRDRRPPENELLARFPEQRLPDAAILAALLSAGFFVTLATFSGIPVSTSQAIVGGVAGAGLGIVGMDPRFFDLDVLFRIFGAWIISPILTMVLAFLIYLLLGRLLKRAGSIAWSRVMGLMVLASAAYVSYSLGANDVGNAIGPLLARFPEQGPWLALLGGVSMALGAATFGSRVTRTVGKTITSLDYGAALAAQLSAAVGVHLFSLAGIPVSTSQAIVGGVIGVGLTRGMRAVSAGRITAIFAGWVATPLSAAALSATLYFVLSGLS